MAKIEMDISEYDIMRENKTLLEKSLENERLLQKDIEKLQEEKIKALEDAKMKVVKITKTEKREVLYNHCDEYSAYQKLCTFLGLNVKDNTHFLRSRVHYQDLIETFFVKNEYFTPTTEEITLHGLDEIKVEIRENLRKELNKEIQNKLDKAEKTLLEHTKLLESNQKLMSDNADLFKYNESLLKERQKLQSQLEIQKETITKELTESITKEEYKKVEKEITEGQIAIKIVSKIKEILGDGYRLFNKSDLLDKIINLTK
jgi:hypothetical protein